MIARASAVLVCLCLAVAGGALASRQAHARSARVVESERSANAARADALHRTGLEAARRGEASLARASMLDALRFDPFHGPARSALATLLVEAGEVETALEILADGRERAPHDAELTLTEARVRASIGESEEAIRLLSAFERPTPRLRATLAALHREAGRLEVAARYWEVALREQPRRAAWWLGLGVAYEGQGRTQEAFAAYENARRLGGLSEATEQWLRTRAAGLGGG